jgi:hypothetical protein
MLQTKSSAENLISLNSAAELTPYSADYLNLLVRREKLPAQKIGRNWYTSQEAIRWYLRRQGKIVRVVKTKTPPTLIPLVEAAQLTPYSTDYLNLLVRRGKLPAKKIGRNWYTSQAAIGWYLARRRTGTRAVTLQETQEEEVRLGRQPSATLRLVLLLVSLMMLFVLLFPTTVFGMSSSNYRINEHFIGAGGRIDETSTSYKLMETLGDVGTGPSTSTNYKLEAGYLSGAGEPRLEFTISTANLPLGVLSPSSVASNSHTMTATSYLSSGFVITAVGPDPLTRGSYTVPWVADGAVNAGSPEYGANFSGGGGSHPGGDIGLGTLQTVTTYTGSASSGDTTTATYKASINSTSAAGDYASTTTYIATATF